MKAIKETTFSVCPTSIYRPTDKTKVTTYHLVHGFGTRYVTKAVNELSGLFAEKFSYNENDALSDHEMIVSNAKNGIDDFVPNDVKYHRAKLQS